MNTKKRAWIHQGLQTEDPNACRPTLPPICIQFEIGVGPEGRIVAPKLPPGIYHARLDRVS